MCLRSCFSLLWFKDKLGNINYSKNYRSVAISSILLKLIDWVIILLEGSLLVSMSFNLLTRLVAPLSCVHGLLWKPLTIF